MSQSPIDDPMLLGYLLGSLDDEDYFRVEEALRDDPALVTKLDQLEREFLPLLHAAEQDIPEPRGDLADRTLRCLKPCCERDRVQSHRRGLLFSRLMSPMRDAECGIESATGRTGVFRNLMELSAFAVSILVFGTLGMSWALNSRERARQQQCSFQLANLGLSIQDYAYHQQGQRAPEIGAEGPTAFAGVYAPRLNDCKLLDEDHSLYCASHPGASVGILGAPNKTLPSVRQLLQADFESLRVYQRWVGGSYSYNLGFVQGGVYHTPRYISRSTFAVLGDSPAVVNGQMNWNIHGIDRCNILFEDGRVQVCIIRFPKGEDRDLDNPYFNQDGYIRAGCDCDDAALGPSHLNPFEALFRLPNENSAIDDEIIRISR